MNDPQSAKRGEHSAGTLRTDAPGAGIRRGSLPPADVPRVAVIGAGLGGLATAMRLSAAGYPVSVYEKQSGPGGKAFSQRIGPYRFDTGPSLFTMRPVFERLFAECGALLDDYLTLIPLERICSYFWKDGTRSATFSDTEEMAAEFERSFREPRQNLRRFLEYSRRIYDITAHLFLERSLHEWSTLAAPGLVRSLLQTPRIDPFRTMDGANRRFFRDPHLRQLFNRYATYNGSSPYRTPATMNIIPHVEYGIGAWAVQGGIHQVPLAMEKRARELGVEFYYNARVDAIVTGSTPAEIGKSFPGEKEESRAGARPGALGRALRGSAKRTVRGVRVNGREYPAEILVSNADVTTTYRDLIGDDDAPPYRRHRALEPSSSGVVFYFGVRRRFPELGLHNIFFSGDYRREFDDIFERHRCPRDPTIYVNITAREGAPADAPSSGENWFVLVNAPWDQGQDWDEEATRLRRTVVDRLSSELGTDLGPLVEAESRMLPPDIEVKTDSARGSLYGISSNTRTAAFRRHPNRSRRYPGLFFVGGSAHPGGGMPLVVLGGGIVADLVLRRYPLSGTS